MQDYTNQFAVDVSLATEEDIHVIANLWPLYQYDLSEVGGMSINGHGLFEEGSVRSRDFFLSEATVWTQRPGALFPFLIRVDGKIAGFALVGAAPQFTPDGGDYCVHEFFILREYRGRGAAGSAASAIFRRLPGRWELRAMAQNLRAQAFWRRTIGATGFERFSEEKRFIPEDACEMIVFQFDGARGADD